MPTQIKETPILMSAAMVRVIQRIEAYFAMTDGDSNGCYVDPVSRKLLREALAALKEAQSDRERLRTLLGPLPIGPNDPTKRKFHDFPYPRGWVRHDPK